MKALSFQTQHDAIICQEWLVLPVRCGPVLAMRFKQPPRLLPGHMRADLIDTFSPQSEFIIAMCRMATCPT